MVADCSRPGSSRYYGIFFPARISIAVMICISGGILISVGISIFIGERFHGKGFKIRLCLNSSLRRARKRRLRRRCENRFFRGGPRRVAPHGKTVWHFQLRLNPNGICMHGITRRGDRTKSLFFGIKRRIHGIKRQPLRQLRGVCQHKFSGKNLRAHFPIAPRGTRAKRNAISRPIQKRGFQSFPQGRRHIVR